MEAAFWETNPVCGRDLSNSLFEFVLIPTRALLNVPSPDSFIEKFDCVDDSNPSSPGRNTTIFVAR